MCAYHFQIKFDTFVSKRDASDIKVNVFEVETSIIQYKLQILRLLLK